MKITPQILAAVRQAVDYYGNTSQVAKAMGIAHSTVFFWLKGKTTSMSGKLWQSRIRPVLAPFLVADQFTNGGNYNGNLHAESPLLLRENPAAYHCTGGVAQIAAHQAALAAGGAVDRAIARASADSSNSVELVPYAALNGLDPSFEPVRKFLSAHSCGKVKFSEVPDISCFAVRLESEFPGVFLPDTALLISTEAYPENDDFVIARLRENGKVVMGRYVRSGNQISLLSVLKGEPDISWDCTVSLGYTLWCYPILEAKLNMRTNNL